MNHVNLRSAIVANVPASVKPAARALCEKIYNVPYTYRLRSRNLQKHNMLILGTIARSGTHYMKFLMSNYLRAAYEDKDKGPITPVEMNEMFPNNWHLLYLNVYKMPIGNIFPEAYKKPTPLLKNIGLDEFTRSHATFQKVFWKNSPVLHLYRNPLDYSVSYYHYMHKNRSGVEMDGIDSPVDVLNRQFVNYVQMYLSYLYAARSGKYKIIRFPYEEIKLHPVRSLKLILRWLGEEPLEKNLEWAAEQASIKKVQKMEGLQGAINPTATNLTGRFARDGGVGQWKEHFNETDFQAAKDKFRTAGIELEDFILE